MADTLYRDSGDAVMLSLTEKQMAQWLREQGKTVLHHGGRYWKAFPNGFYRSIHWMGRMREKEAVRPSPLCWGFRTALASGDSGAANSSIPVNLLTDLADYDLGCLSSRRRTKVRSSLKKIRTVEVLRPDVLLEQGHRVYLSAFKRHGYGRLLNTEQFRNHVMQYFNPRRGMIFAGLIGNELGGFIETEAVDGTAYIKGVHIAREALSINLGTGLLYKLLQVFKRSAGIREVVHGLHTAENKPLTDFKTGMGFSVVYVPSRVWFAPMMGHAIRWLKPHTYYRLTGKKIA